MKLCLHRIVWTDLEVVAEQVPGLSSSFRLISLIYGNIKCAFTTQHHFLYELINCTSRSLKIIVTMVIYINGNAGKWPVH